MRTTEPQVSMSAVPPPGTTEALELGCTCHLIAHEVVTQERAGGHVDRSRSELSMAWN
jgi:hypothetical protein